MVDPHGNLLVADTGNHVVRFISLNTGIITTVAGTPSITVFDPNSIGDGGPATQAELSSPAALALDMQEIFISPTPETIVSAKSLLLQE